MRSRLISVDHWRPRANRAMRIAFQDIGLAVVGGLSFGLVRACEHLRQGPASVRLTRAFLEAVRAEDYSRAYLHVCTGARSTPSKELFAKQLGDAHARGHGVTSYELHAEFGDDSLSPSTVKAAVTFADGSQQQLTIFATPPNAPGCLDSGELTRLWA